MQIGDKMITHMSRVEGEVMEIVPNKNGASSAVRLRLENGGEKWTTIFHSLEQIGYYDKGYIKV